MNPHRGHESVRHIEAKAAIGRLFDDSAWSVFFEQRNADVLVMHHATRFMAAIEVESSPKNVINNILRNIAYGCEAIAVVSLKRRPLAQITNKITRNAPLYAGCNIREFSFESASLNELRAWITDLAHSKTPHIGGKE